MNATSTSRVGAVIACLDPPASLVDATRETLRQVGRVVAVDDGSGPESAPVFAALTALGVEVVHQPNAGIAAALNAGVARLREPAAGAEVADEVGAGTSYVLTLDQDSALHEAYVVAALAAVAALEEAGTPYGFVAAQSYSGRRAPTAGRVPGLALERAFDPMQSGWLVPLTTFAALGPLDEGLVVDGVDSEFTVRCRAAGLPPVVAPGAALRHGQGERVPGRVLGRRVGAVNHHSPTRVRYMARNGTLITRRYVAAQPRWVLRRLAAEGAAHLLRLALDPDRRRIAAAIVLGWRDGLVGRTGPIGR